jgi:hypothetical protein
MPGVIHPSFARIEIMNRILAALIASAALLAFSAPASAQTGAMAAPTKAAKMSTMGSSMKSSSMGAMKMAPTTCPKGQSMVKGYKKKDGTTVAAYCRKSK